MWRLKVCWFLMLAWSVLLTSSASAEDVFVRPQLKPGPLENPLKGRLRKAQRTEIWQVAVVGGEMVPNKAKEWLGRDFDTTLTMLNRSHFTWVGPYCPALEKSKDEQFLKRSEELVRKMGYELQITELVHPAQVKTKHSARLALKGKNLGVASSPKGEKLDDGVR